MHKRQLIQEPDPGLQGHQRPWFPHYAWTIGSEETPEGLLIAAEEALQAPENDEPTLRALYDGPRVQAALARLPARERDILDLLARGCRQSDIAVMLDNVSQPAISYLFQRSKRRLRWLLVEEGSLFTADELRIAILPHLEEEFVELLTVAWRTTCESEALKAAGFEDVPPGRAATALFSETIKRVGRIPELALYHRGLTALCLARPWRWGILHEWAFPTARRKLHVERKRRLGVGEP